LQLRTFRCPPTRRASSARRWRWSSPTSIAAAKDGAERVAIDYQPLPAVTQAVAAAEMDAPRLWEEATSNVLIDAEVGNAAATAAAFARAAHVVRLETWIRG